MYAWIRGLSQRFDACKYEDHITENMQEVINNFGFEYFTFAVLSATPFIKPKIKVFGFFL